MNYLAHIDARLIAQLERDEARLAAGRPGEPLPRLTQIVLVGHRAAGKTRLLPEVSHSLGLPSVDLDHEIAREVGGASEMARMVERDEPRFRRIERACFQRLARGQVVAAGGGFLAHHGDLLRGCVAVQIPVTEETYRERNTADTSRPRLHPHLSLEDELRLVWTQRERIHAQVEGLLTLPELAHRARQGFRPRRVVTLPKNVSSPLDFARRARQAGAELLEVRTDLYDGDVAPLMLELPLLISERGRPLPEAWFEFAQLVDLEFEPTRKVLRRLHGRADGSTLLSLHAPNPLKTEDAMAQWADLPRGVLIKHVEPLTDPKDTPRLLELQRRLLAVHGPGVTVLATGPLALPLRARLGVENALNYTALEPSLASAPGQQLLHDVTREHRAGRLRSDRRLGILGSNISHARSPSVHPQPFDRIDLPADADVEALLASLDGHRGLAVTSPFKQRVVPGQSGNTLVRRNGTWELSNTDVVGALAALKKLFRVALERRAQAAETPSEVRARRIPRDLSVPTEVNRMSPREVRLPNRVRDLAAWEKLNAERPALPREHGAPPGLPPHPKDFHRSLTVLGEGGVAVAFRKVAPQLGIELVFARRDALPADCPAVAVWTWPPDVEPPRGLVLTETVVGVIAYGIGGHRVATAIRAAGGVPVFLGSRWFAAQARAQREVWSAG